MAFLASAMAFVASTMGLFLNLFHALINLGLFLNLTTRFRSSAMDDSWKELHGDMMGLISEKVSLSDRRSLLAVCKSWKSMKKDSIFCVKELPWLVLPRHPTSPDICFLNLSQSSLERIDLPDLLRDAEFICSTNGWLAFIKETQIVLCEPVSRKLLKPPLLPETPCSIDWVSQRPINVDYVFDIAISSDQPKPSTMVAATLCRGLELVVWKIGDQEWTLFTGNYTLEEYEEMMDNLVVEDNNKCYFAYLLFLEDNLFVVSYIEPHQIGQSPHPDHSGIYFLGPLLVIFINVLLEPEDADVSALCSQCISLPNEVEDGDLVQSLCLTTPDQGDHLFLAVQLVERKWVDREGEDNPTCFHSTKRFIIYNLDLEDGGFGVVLSSRLTDIGNKVIFLGSKCIKVIDCTNFSGIEGNSVIFLKHTPEQDGDVYICRDSGEYNLQNDRVIRSLPSCLERFNFRLDWFSPQSFPIV